MPRSIINCSGPSSCVWARFIYHWPHSSRHPCDQVDYGPTGRAWSRPSQHCPSRGHTRASARSRSADRPQPFWRARCSSSSTVLALEGKFSSLIYSPSLALKRRSDSTALRSCFKVRTPPTRPSLIQGFKDLPENHQRQGRLTENIGRRERRADARRSARYQSRGCAG